MYFCFIIYNFILFFIFYFLFFILFILPSICVSLWVIKEILLGTSIWIIFRFGYRESMISRCTFEKELNFSISLSEFVQNHTNIFWFSVEPTYEMFESHIRIKFSIVFYKGSNNCNCHL